MDKYNQDLERNQANYVPLSPLSFLRRAAEVFPDRLAVIHGVEQYTWSETFSRCRRLGSALISRGIQHGDTVAVMAPNIPALMEAHFGVPAVGGVLNALNIRLDAETIAFILDHAEAKALITDREFSPVISEALSKLDKKPLVIDIDDPLSVSGERLGELTYEELLVEGNPDAPWMLPSDEWNAISLNYTSGTTGRPKGVMYSHRGATLNALGQIGAHSLT